MTTVLVSLNSALHQLFSEDERIFLIGQDILDPYGGAFKVSEGLSSAFPARVLSAPISEAGMVGIAAGMAMRGFLPIVEIMFGDFLPLAADQIVNHLAKFRWMYNGKVKVPVLIRTPMGGRRGYGPTHSQTLEKMFLGLPGIQVIAPTNLGDPGGLLKQAVLYEEEPIIFVENKLLYLLPLADVSDNSEFEYQELSHARTGYPCYRVNLKGAPFPAVTIAAYGYMAEIARQAMHRLAYEFEIFTELVIPTILSPFDLSPLADSLRKTSNLLTIEESGLSMGWGAEILARAVEDPDLPVRLSKRSAALDLPIPASPVLEAHVLPGADDIVQSVREMLIR